MYPYRRGVLCSKNPRTTTARGRGVCSRTFPTMASDRGWGRSGGSFRTIYFKRYLLYRGRVLVGQDATRLEVLPTRPVWLAYLKFKSRLLGETKLQLLGPLVRNGYLHCHSRHRQTWYLRTRKGSKYPPVWRVQDALMRAPWRALTGVSGRRSPFWVVVCNILRSVVGKWMPFLVGFGSENRCKKGNIVRV
jgi:hypothetical protein